jgi:uncharacterized protein YfaP (DUF2135 family)
MQIRLDPMTETEYHEFRATNVAAYAAGKVDAGTEGGISRQVRGDIREAAARRQCLARPLLVVQQEIA